MTPNDKLIRWFDVLAALLRRRFPASFEELARDVPAYQHTGAPSDTLLRMFERDKDELRRAGVRIETIAGDDSEPPSYRLRAEHFYLPYLVLAGAESTAESPSPNAGTPPAARRGSGARQLPTLAVLPEEAVMLRRAAERVRALGEPQLVQDATQALRKLRYDLPDTLPAPPVLEADTARSAFALIADAIQRRKQILFVYHSMGRGETDNRRVDPYGLVYLTGNWYLVAHDPMAGGLRHFRTSRMAHVKLNTEKANSPDFEVPRDFDLRSHARSRQSWELGTGDAEDIDVRFVAESGDVTAARRHAATVLQNAATPSGDTSTATRPVTDSALRFRVRRRDSFLRWMLSFAGHAEPVAPPAVVSDWRALLEATRAVHGQDPVRSGPVSGVLA